MSKLLGLIPAKVLTAAVERDAAADKTKKLIGTRCTKLMTPWLVNNDPAGCTVLQHVFGVSHVAIVRQQPKHTVPAEQHSEQPSLWAAPRFGAPAFGTQT
jgi:hypothetical protein